jgi:hypothetical protein
LDDLVILVDENDRDLFTDEPDNTSIEGTIEEISDNNLDEWFYDANSDVSIDELLASYVQFTATNDLDPDITSKLFPVPKGKCVKRQFKKNSNQSNTTRG